MYGGQSLCVGKSPLQEHPQVPQLAFTLLTFGRRERNSQSWLLKEKGLLKWFLTPLLWRTKCDSNTELNSLTRVLGSALQSPRPPGVEPIEPWDPHFQRDSCCLRGAEIRTQVSVPCSEWQPREERKAKNEKVPLRSCQYFGGCKRLEQTFQTQTVHGDTQPRQLECGPVGWYYTICVILVAMCGNSSSS